MMSTKEVSILCRYGGDFVEESNNEVFYKGGTNRIIRLPQEINYSSLLSNVLEVCKWSRTQIGSIKYKHPECGLDCLVSLENDGDIDNMMKEFSQNNGPIKLFVFETQKIPLHKTIIPSTGKEVAKNHQGSKEMPRPNSTMNINAETAGVPTVGLRSGMENELAMDNRSATTNNRTNHGYVSDTLLASRMELEEGRETSFQPNAKTADDTLPPLQPGMEIEEGQEMLLQWNSNMDINAKIAGMPAYNLQSRMDHEFGTDNRNLSGNDGTEYCCANNHKRPRMELEEGQEFSDEKAFHKFLRQYAINLNFEYKRTRSGHGRFAASCIEKDCPWKIRVLRLSNQSTFKITSLERKHTCDLGKHLERTTHRQATMEWIADIVEDGNYLQCAPEFVTDLIKKKYGFNINYHKARRGIKLACKRRNSVGNSCQGYDSDYNVYKICEDIRRTNPGSRVKLQRKSADGNYLKLFISYEAAVIPIFRMVGRRAVELFRVKVGVKRPFAWLLATGRDTDERALLLACGFIELDEEEEDLLEDYKWFCLELFYILCQLTNLTFMVEYTHDGKVLELVRSIFPHSHCRFDQSSFVAEISNNFDTLNPWLLWRAMTTLKQSVFEERMCQILEQCGEAWEFLRNVNPEYWARSHFKGDFGYNVMLFYWLKTERHKKDVSIVELVEHLHNLMMERFIERVKCSSSWKSILLPRYENKPSIDVTISHGTTRVRFLVPYLGSDDCEEVDIEMRHCSCNRWQLLGYPCDHAETVIEALQQNRYDYWDDCYKTTVYKEAYSQAVVHPLRRRGLKNEKLVNEMIADFM